MCLKSIFFFSFLKERKYINEQLFKNTKKTFLSENFKVSLRSYLEYIICIRYFLQIVINDAADIFNAF